MGTIVKKETYTATQPDGTVVTTTTTSTTQQDAYVMETNYGPLHFTHLMSPVGILRILEIIIGFAIVGCVTGARLCLKIALNSFNIYYILIQK